jgi:hypothetical protein
MIQEEFSIFEMDSHPLDSSINFCGCTIGAQTTFIEPKILKSKNGIIELNDLKYIDWFIELSTSYCQLHFNINLKCSIYNQHESLEVISYVIKPIGEDFINHYYFSESIKNLTSFLKYCGITYEQYSDKSFNPTIFDSSIKIPLFIRKRNLNSSISKPSDYSHDVHNEIKKVHR